MLRNKIFKGPRFGGVIVAALLSAVAFNSTAAEVTASAVRDWGSGFQASYTVTIEESDTLNGVLSDWLIEVQQPESINITNGWTSGYNGGIDTFSSGSTFSISNASQGFKPDLIAGRRFNFTVQGSKPSGISIDENTFTVEFTSLDEPPEPVAEVVTSAEATSVQDWFNPRFGGGFNANFECELAASTVSSVDIQLNYLGDGVLQRTSLQGYLGASTQVVSNGNTTVISSSDVPSQTGTVRFQVGVNGAGFSASDFSISCTSGDGIPDIEEPEPACEALVYYQDADGDGYTTSDTTEACLQPTGYLAQPSNILDCDDGNVDAFEVLTFFGDLDNDEFTAGSTSSCGVPAGYVEVPSLMEDCNDNSAGINPNASEIADDGIDQNCDGVDLESVPGCLIGDAFVETGIPQQECDALISLYDSTDGPNWRFNSGWNTPSNPCFWRGVSCSQTNVTGLSLSSNELSGSIPAELGNLSRLQNLVLERNDLEGSVPAELGSLSSLQHLLIGINDLVGSIPVELGNLSDLVTLSLRINNLNGTIPAELGNLGNLQNFDLTGNELSGSIPSELGNLSNLQDLSLGSNQLTGSIPAELASLSNLLSINIVGNELSGSIPAELGNLSSLVSLQLTGNELSGSIPPGLGNLSNLESIGISRNNLSGPIPSEIGNLSNLETLSWYGNELSGSIPEEFGNLGNIQTIALSNNELSGSIPAELGNLSNLEFLSLHTNELSGSIPAEFGDLSSLELLALNGNELSGSIPADLGALSNLTRLHLEDNQLSGDLSPLGSLSGNFTDFGFSISGNGCFASADLTTAAFLDMVEPGWEAGCL